MTELKAYRDKKDGDTVHIAIPYNHPVIGAGHMHAGSMHIDVAEDLMGRVVTKLLAEYDEVDLTATFQVDGFVGGECVFCGHPTYQDGDGLWQCQVCEEYL